MGQPMKRITGLLVAAMASALTVLAIHVLDRSTTIPAVAQTIGAPIACNASIAVSGNTATTTQLVALSAGRRIYVCAVTFVGAGATTAKLVTGTGSNCASGQSDLTGAMTLGSGTAISAAGVAVPVSQALCWTNSGAVQVSGVISYRQF